MPYQTISSDHSTRFGSFREAYEFFGWIQSGIEMVRLDLGKAPALIGKPLYMPIFKLQGTEIEAIARLLVKEDRRALFDRLFMLNEVRSWLHRDGDQFRVDVHVECSWDAAYLENETEKIQEHYQTLVQMATEPENHVPQEEAMPVSLKLLAQKITARPNTIVDLVQIKDDLFSLAVTDKVRRMKEQDPYLIFYYSAASGQAGAEFLKKNYYGMFLKATRCLVDVDPALFEKLGKLEQPRFIDNAKANQVADGMADDASFFAMQYLYVGDPVFFNSVVVQSMDAIGIAFRAAGGAIHEVTEGIANVGQMAGNFFTDVGHAIGDLFSGSSGDAGGLVIVVAIAILIGIASIVVCIGVFAVQKLMSMAEKASSSMTYYLGKKGKIKKFRPPRIYRDDFF
jgi:hypothetical protein